MSRSPKRSSNPKETANDQDPKTVDEVVAEIFAARADEIRALVRTRIAEPVRAIQSQVFTSFNDIPDGEYSGSQLADRIAANQAALNSAITADVEKGTGEEGNPPWVTP